MTPHTGILLNICSHSPGQDISCLLQNLNLRNWRKETIWRSRRRCEDGIKMDVREIGWRGGGCVEWIHLAQDRDWWQAVVNTVINLRVLTPQSERVSLSQTGFCYVYSHLLWSLATSSLDFRLGWQTFQLGFNFQLEDKHFIHHKPLQRQ
jgi:hypothetical protein